MHHRRSSKIYFLSVVDPWTDHPGFSKSHRACWFVAPGLLNSSKIAGSAQVLLQLAQIIMKRFTRVAIDGDWTRPNGAGV